MFLCKWSKESFLEKFKDILQDGILIKSVVAFP